MRKRGTEAFMQPGGKIEPGEAPRAALRRSCPRSSGSSSTRRRRSSSGASGRRPPTSRAMSSRRRSSACRWRVRWRRPPRSRRSPGSTRPRRAPSPGAPHPRPRAAAPCRRGTLSTGARDAT
ncbi:hypothetical protein [Methylobacterium organophilum]|uniref:hypothetical protein n=1 Tax=Methylobacterium organophilum TaxID=410 RepID=UPI003084564E